MADRRRHVLLRAGQITAIGVLAIVVVTQLTPEATSRAYRAEGEPLPVPTAQLAAVDADSFGGILVGLRGTPVVVNVWASWCAPCRVEMPLLDRAADEYAGRVSFLGLASRDSRAGATGFLDELDVSYPNVFDADGEVRRALGVRGFPTTFIFDSDGQLLEAVVGGITEQRLAAQLQDLGS